MRTWGRIGGTDGIGGTWTLVETDSSGFNDNVFLTTTCQILKLALSESPMFGNYGIPATQSVATQVAPDIYVALTQQLMAQNFASLLINRVQGSFPPVYTVQATFHPGATLPKAVAT